MKKVSILTPCYNGALFIKRYMDMLMEQQVPDMELILVDDGSTDDTADIVKGYKDILAQHDIELHYVFQQHQGQAVAINNGLPYVTGEYLIYPDSDDILLPGSIRRRAEFLDSHPDYDLVGTRGWDVLEGDFKPLKNADFSQEEEVDDLFTTLIEKGWNTFTCSYMVRTAKLFATIPEGQIYTNKSCTLQDVQLLLLSAYNSKCGFLQEYLYKRVIRSGSHSNDNKTYLEEAVRCEAVKDVFMGTLKQLNLEKDKFNYYKKCVHDRYHGQIKALIFNYLLVNEPVEMKHKIQQFLAGRKLALFGTGTDCNNAVKAFKEADVDIELFIDNNPAKQESSLAGKKIVGITEIIPRKNDYFVLIMTDRYKTAIAQQLKGLGFHENQEYCIYNRFRELL